MSKKDSVMSICSFIVFLRCWKKVGGVQIFHIIKILSVTMFFLFGGLLLSLETCHPYLYDYRFLLEIKKRVRERDPLFEQAVRALMAVAEDSLFIPIGSVMDKTGIPPSQDKHDYMSLARYWWPNPKKKNGIPYGRRDGVVNPMIRDDKYDYDRKCKMTDACKVLSWAYFLSEDERYAECAARRIRTWFLDSNTRMNPNLNYAQGIPGVTTGRAAGLIETSPFPALFDAVRVLSGSRAWTADDQAGLERWIRRYLKWMLESSAGIKESRALNNQGSWYDFQVAYFAVYTHQDKLAKEWLEAHTFRRLDNLFNRDMLQPFELDRTKSFFYSVYNLYALFSCARVGELVGVDLWEVELGEGSRLRKALDALLPYALGEKGWVNKDIEPVDGKLLAPLLLMAAIVYEDRLYVEAYNQIKGNEILNFVFEINCLFGLLFNN